MDDTPIFISHTKFDSSSDEGTDSDSDSNIKSEPYDLLDNTIQVLMDQFGEEKTKQVTPEKKEQNEAELPDDSVTMYPEDGESAKDELDNYMALSQLTPKLVNGEVSVQEMAQITGVRTEIVKLWLI